MVNDTPAASRILVKFVTAKEILILILLYWLQEFKEPKFSETPLNPLPSRPKAFESKLRTQHNFTVQVVTSK